MKVMHGVCLAIFQRKVLPQMFDKIEITKFYKNAYGYEIELTVGLYTYGDISSLIQSLTLCEREFYNFFDKFVAEQKENSNKVIESKEDQVSVYPELFELKMDLYVCFKLRDVS